MKNRLSMRMNLLPVVILVFLTCKYIFTTSFTPSQVLVLEQRHVFTGQVPGLVQSFKKCQEMTRMTGRRFRGWEIPYTLQHLIIYRWIGHAVLTCWIGAFSKQDHANAPIHMSHDEFKFVIHCAVLSQPCS